MVDDSSVASLSVVGEGDDDLDVLEKSQEPSSTASGTGDDDEGGTALAQKESKAVFYLRIIVFFALFVAATFVSVGVYVYTKNDEMEEFESEVDSSAHMLINSFNDALERRVGAMNSLSTAITSYALESGSRFPNVTLPHFAERGADFRIQADSFVVHYAPYITNETRSAWEEYAMANRHQIDEAFATDSKMRAYQDKEMNYVADEDGDQRMLQEDPPSDPNVLPDGSGYHVGIWSNGAILPAGRLSDNDGPYLPLWQRSPINPSKQGMVNMDFDKTPAGGGAISHLKEKEAVLSRTLVPIPAMQKQVIGNLKFGQYRHDFEGYVADPMTYFAYPVFTSFDRETQELGGVIFGNLWWRMLFADILTDSAVGYICVLSNSFNQTISYRVDGDRAVYIGKGDLHDPKYDHLEVSANMNENMQKKASAETRSYLTVPAANDYGVYTLKVYPSKDTEATFRSQRPLHYTLVYTLVTAAIFAVTCLVFIAFAALVEYRQKVVMGHAVASGAIISSLFPENVKERLYNHTAKDKIEQHAKKTRNNTWKIEEGRVDGMEGVGHNVDGPPIADEFPNCTVLFADLTGFTSWSSSRKPTEVFELLETLYGSFDTAAAKYDVFKVETVGDCYVAATGIPRAQEDHAVIMARFARYCLRSTSKLLTGKLSDRLGPDTEHMQLRVGLHSGPVTGGVLRGKKARFQLFGDTVNTTSRIESTGMGGRIHVSDATANELKAKGKGHWLKQREDQVQAKGKGVMQTHWLDPMSTPTSRSKPVSVTHSVLSEEEAALRKKRPQQQHNKSIRNTPVSSSIRKPSITDREQIDQTVEMIRARLAARYNA